MCRGTNKYSQVSSIVYNINTQLSSGEDDLIEGKSMPGICVQDE